MTGGELVGQVLHAQGVRWLFTLCGGHISPILVGAKQRGIQVVDVRHEVTAVFAADAAARLTGVPGVAAVTAGPGVSNTITALKNAQLAESPLVLLGGATATMLRGRGSLQDVDQMAMVRPHVKWAGAARRVRELVPLLERAFREAQTGVPGPVFVECPVDLLYSAALVNEWYAAKGGGAPGLSGMAVRWYLRRHVQDLFAGADAAAAGPRIEVARSGPDASDLPRAAALLSRAQKPVLIVGSAAVRAGRTDALAAAINTLGAPVYLSGMARGLLGPRSPLQVRHRRKEALREADLVVILGVPFDFRLDYGHQVPRRTPVISAHLSPAALKLNRRPTVGLLADPGLVAEDLAAQVTGGAERWAGWRDSLRARDAERDGENAAHPPGAKGAVDPLHLCHQIEAALGEADVLVADGGDFVATASYVVRPRGPLSWLDPGAYGTLGVGGGFALAAALARPSSVVWLLYGDGSAGYSLAELDTFVRHGLGVVAVVGNDAGWTQIAREQVEVLKDDVGTVLRSTDYHRVAHGWDARGLVIDDPAEALEVLQEARQIAQKGVPVVVNARLGKTDFRKGSLSM